MNVDVRAEGGDERGGGPPRVLGRYRVIAELGRGSTSIVYLGAVNGPAGFNKLFALKMLRPALAYDPAMVALFLAEARIGAQLNHPNVVSTLEIEEREALPFIVMEYLDGKPLQDVITAARIAFAPLPLHMHLAALSGALEGLGHAHSAAGPGAVALQIVHRDVSPHNVFITSSGMPKVLDFGFAQSADSPNTMLTSAARVAYMSPEQADGALVDARSDLFSVGVMLWEAATRRRFWTEEASKADILLALRSRALPIHRISALAKSSEELRSMIVKATEPDPDRRYETAAALQTDLRAVLNQTTPPTFALRDLGHRVATLFAADRARLQRAIDEHGVNMEASSEDLRTPVVRSEPSNERAARAAPRSDPPGAPAALRTPLPAPAAEAARPLPSFPMPSIEVPRGWRAHRQSIAGASVALAVALGIGLSALHASHDGPESPTAATAMAASPGTTAIQPAVEGSQPTATLRRALASATAESTSATALEMDESAPAAASAHPSSTSYPRPAYRPWPPRSASGAPGPATTRASTPSRNDGRPGGSDAWEEGPIHFPETPAPGARPPHPIDSTNPYPP